MPPFAAAITEEDRRSYRFLHRMEWTKIGDQTINLQEIPDQSGTSNPPDEEGDGKPGSLGFEGRLDRGLDEGNKNNGLLRRRANRGGKRRKRGGKKGKKK